MPPPTEEMWKNVAAKYKKKMWHFPNCIGAFDVKHINIQYPINAGSTYYNYKGSHSVVLLALVDADYKFIAIDVSSYGRNSAGGIFSQSVIGQKLNNKTLNVPEPTPLTENGDPQPYVIVGDEAFPLKSYSLRPYSRIQGIMSPIKYSTIDCHEQDALSRTLLEYWPLVGGVSVGT